MTFIDVLMCALAVYIGLLVAAAAYLIYRFVCDENIGRDNPGALVIPLRRDRRDDAA